MSLFTDLIKQARGFGDSNEPWKKIGEIKTDNNGWPIEDFGIVVYSGRKNYYDKIYNLTFDIVDKVPEIKFIKSTGTIKNIKITNNRYSAKLYLPKDNTQLILSFKHIGSGIKNIKIIDEKYKNNEVFTEEFIEMHKYFKVLRFMELKRINETSIENWKDRTKKEDIFQNKKDGIAWEYIIDIANTLNKDIWINIPYKANNEYIKSLALLLKNGLNKNLNIYIEYSNEYWNTIFPQNTWLKEQYIEQIEKNKNLKEYKVKNEYFKATLIAVEKLIKINKIFSEIFGKSEINNRVRIIIGAQIVWTDVIKTQLKYIKKYYGKPNKYFYGFAGGAYINVENPDNKNFNDIYNFINNKIENSPLDLQYKENVKISKKYNIKFLAYEGGIDIAGNDFKSSNEIEQKFIQTEDYVKLMKKYLDIWDRYTDNSLFMWYKSGASNNWGFVESMDNLKNKKFIKIKKLLLDENKKE
ncbi:hypothetical protein [Hypnocyclicus thermotrophus]|nr:hypothetical protein [Hypnocyclicus thermotrophus]